MRNVLIVDESAPVRDVLRSVLEGQQDLAVCGEAADGIDAVAKLEKLKPDLILLDLQVPKLNGVETAALIRRHSPTVPVLLFTMYETEFDALGVLMLLKADGLRNLVERIRQSVPHQSAQEQDRTMAPERAN